VHKNLFSIHNTLLHNRAQNKANSDDNIVLISDCVTENLSEVESNDSNNEIGDNKESDRKIKQ
jgi:hypothetical protein